MMMLAYIWGATFHISLQMSVCVWSLKGEKGNKTKKIYKRRRKYKQQSQEEILKIN